MLIHSKELSWVIATISLTLGVFFRNVIGFKISVIMIEIGVFSMSYYLVQRGISNQVPKFIVAQRKLSLSLWFMAAGATIGILTIIQSMLSNSGLINTTFLAIGAAILIGGCAALVVSVRFASQ